MTTRTSICAMAMAVAAAAAGDAAAEAPRPTRPAPIPATRGVRATPWKSAPTRIAWPAASRRRELVVSRGWKADESYVWFVADGGVVAVYLTASQTELQVAIGQFVRDVTLAQQSSPTDALSWGIAGAIPKNPPPPPPPEPGGIPEWYVEAVRKTATNLDTQVLLPQLDRSAITLPAVGGVRQTPGTVVQPAPRRR